MACISPVLNIILPLEREFLGEVLFNGEYPEPRSGGGAKAEVPPIPAPTWVFKLLNGL